MKPILASIKKALKSVNSVLIVAHIDPDGDCIGSMLALAMILEKLGITATTYCEDGVPRIYRFLAGADRVKKDFKCAERFPLAFAVDSSDLDRLGTNINLKDCAKFIINIDHHPDNSHFGNINYIFQRSCAAELIYRLCKYLKIEIDAKMAECLYVALITDTGNFRYESTSEETFAMAADLLKAGVKTHELTTKIYDNKTVASLRINSLALTNLEISSDRQIAWATVTEAMMEQIGAKGEDLIGLVDRIRSVEGIEVAVLFREEKGKIKINFRSKARINVSEIASHFNGGGHHKAAGAVVEGDIDQVKKRVIEDIEKYVKASKFLV